ncbi:hypothetical protein M9458_010643, partial [Cirrhinus mrigala]
GAITPLPSLESTEEANIMESDPESKKLEEEDGYDDADDKEDYDGGDEDHDYEKEKGEAKDANQSMWKTRLLPEEELFTTHTSNSEEDSGQHTLDTSPSLPDEEEGGTYHPSKGS